MQNYPTSREQVRKLRVGQPVEVQVKGFIRELSEFDGRGNIGIIDQDVSIKAGLSNGVDGIREAYEKAEESMSTGPVQPSVG